VTPLLLVLASSHAMVSVPAPAVVVMPSPSVMVAKTGSAPVEPTRTWPFVPTVKAVIAEVPDPTRTPWSVNVLAPVPPWSTPSIPVETNFLFASVNTGLEAVKPFAVMSATRYAFKIHRFVPAFKEGETMSGRLSVAPEFASN